MQVASQNANVRRISEEERTDPFLDAIMGLLDGSKQVERRIERTDPFLDAIMGLLDGSKQVERRIERTGSAEVTVFRVVDTDA